LHRQANNTPPSQLPIQLSNPNANNNSVANVSAAARVTAPAVVVATASTHNTVADPQVGDAVVPSIGICNQCLMQDMLRTQRIHALCRVNQQHLSATNDRLAAVESQLAAIQTTLQQIASTTPPAAPIAVKEKKEKTQANTEEKTNREESVGEQSVGGTSVPDDARTVDVGCQTDDVDESNSLLVTGRVRSAPIPIPLPPTKPQDETPPTCSFIGSPFILINDKTLYFQPTKS
jgi:hypothetical protein